MKHPIDFFVVMNNVTHSSNTCHSDKYKSGKCKWYTTFYHNNGNIRYKFSPIMIFQHDENNRLSLSFIMDAITD